MGDFLKNVETKIKKHYQENEAARSEDLFCRKCVRYFASKSDFCQHVQEHIEENNDCRTHYMSYIEKYICNSCGQQFEEKSGLVEHWNTVCLDAAYTCRHCKENCEDLSALQMHLFLHHKYSTEMLRDEGFLMYADTNRFKSESSFIKSSRSKAFKSPPAENKDEFHSGNNSTFQKESPTNRKSRRVGRKRQDSVYNSVTKAHVCELCKQSFSRKCVLDTHAKKHVLKHTKEKKIVGGILQTSLIMKTCENTVPESKNTVSAVVPGQNSNSVRNTLKIGTLGASSIWKNVQPKYKLPGVKSSALTKSELRKRKMSDIFKDRYSSTNKDISRPSEMVANTSPGNKVKLTSKIPNIVASYMKNDPEGTNSKCKLRSDDSKIAASVDQKTLEALKKHVERRSKIKNAAASDEKNGPESSIISLQIESNTAKEYKNPQQIFGKYDLICEICKKRFQSTFGLKRHYLKHT